MHFIYFADNERLNGNMSDGRPNSRCSRDLFELVKSAVEIIQLTRKRRLNLITAIAHRVLGRGISSFFFREPVLVCICISLCLLPSVFHAPV